MTQLFTAHPRESGALVSRRQAPACVGTSGLVLASVFLLSACASTGSYDLRPAYKAEADEAVSRHLDCDGVSDLICDCRRGGLEQEFAAPSPKHFDHGYAVLAAEIEEGATEDEAKSRAVKAVFTAVTADVEDICTELEEAS